MPESCPYCTDLKTKACEAIWAWYPCWDKNLLFVREKPSWNTNFSLQCLSISSLNCSTSLYVRWFGQTHCICTSQIENLVIAELLNNLLITFKHACLDSRMYVYFVSTSFLIYQFHYVVLMMIQLVLQSPHLLHKRTRYCFSQIIQTYNTLLTWIYRPPSQSFYLRAQLVQFKTEESNVLLFNLINCYLFMIIFC